jgi:two-component system OmpR family sensor kinase
MIGLVTPVAAGLIVANVATYLALQSFLMQRVDDQLRAGQDEAYHALVPDEGPHGQLGGRPPPPGGNWGITYAALYQGGRLVTEGHFNGLGLTTSSTEHPVLPSPLPVDGVPRTVRGTGSVNQFRVEAAALDSTDGTAVVVAIPLTDVQSTLKNLLLIEGLSSLGVLAGLAALAWWIIGIGLRPLERMGSTAQEIAGGDLSRRVEPATPRSEIGRLGLALNGMLSQIESAFAEQTQSEQRLRRFMAAASHELRTPLTSIRGYAELLRRGAAEKPEDASLARRRIEEEAIRMSGLVDDMLLLARLDQGRPLEQAPVDLTAIARDTCLDAGAVARNRTITLDAADKVVVSGDEMRLRQVVGNLVRNALVHTPSGSPIEVSVARRNGSAVLTVVDHGPGLVADDGTRVFEAFYRSDPSRTRDRGGSGLGLSIVAAVVAAHRGGVQALETEGGGATFRVELPLHSPS